MSCFRIDDRARALVLLVLSLSALTCGGAVSTDSRASGDASEVLALTLENIFRKAGGARRAVPSPGGEWIAVVGSDEDVEGRERSGIFLVSSSPGGPPPR